MCISPQGPTLCIYGILMAIEKNRPVLLYDDVNRVVFIVLREFYGAGRNQGSASMDFKGL